jgi:hypothetical protein
MLVFELGLGLDLFHEFWRLKGKSAASSKKANERSYREGSNLHHKRIISQKSVILTTRLLGVVIVILDKN